jgi:hypothetical protein
MEKANTHYLLKYYGTGEEEAYHESSCKVEKHHPLRQLLRKLPQTYLCQGTSKELSSVPLIMTDGNLSCGTVGSPNLDKLWKSSTKSSFGRGSKTVFDEQVRRGSEVMFSQLAFGSLEVSKVHATVKKQKIEVTMEELIRSEIFDKLPADFIPKDAQIEFYKLAIYEAGGHFAVHRDSVRSATHQATLLIEVTSEHEGGGLALKRNGDRFVWN